MHPGQMLLASCQQVAQAAAKLLYWIVWHDLKQRQLDPQQKVLRIG